MVIKYIIDRDRELKNLRDARKSLHDLRVLLTYGINFDDYPEDKEYLLKTKREIFDAYYTVVYLQQKLRNLL